MLSLNYSHDPARQFSLNSGVGRNIQDHSGSKNNAFNSVVSRCFNSSLVSVELCFWERISGGMVPRGEIFLWPKESGCNEPRRQVRDRLPQREKLKNPTALQFDVRKRVARRFRGLSQLRRFN